MFQAICRGKKKVKTPAEIAHQMRIPKIRVLQEALRLSNEDIIRKHRIKGIGLVYEKYPFYCQHQDKIIPLALNKAKLREYPTSYQPRMTSNALTVGRLSFPKTLVDVRQISIDEVDSFSKVSKIAVNGKDEPTDERWFKDGLRRILGEDWKFQDWGGEKNDFFSTRLRLAAKRVRVAFALKGKATKQPLTPRKMGKHGDQIQRLLSSPADVFLVQFWGHIEESVIKELETYAIAKSWAERRRIYYGIIDGQDSRRMAKAYPSAFV